MLIGLVYLGSVGYVLDEKDAHNLNGIKDQPQCVNVNWTEKNSRRSACICNTDLTWQYQKNDINNTNSENDRLQN